MQIIRAYFSRACRFRVAGKAAAEAKAAAEKKQFCGLVPGLQPVKTAGALHPSAAEKNGRKTALPGDGSQLRPWPPSAPRLARCACECVRARWAVAVFALEIVIFRRSREQPKFAYFLACAYVRPPRPPCIYIFIYYIYILKGGCVLCPRIMRASVCVFRARLQRRAAALCVRYARAMPLCAPVACSVHIHGTSAPRPLPARFLRVSCVLRGFRPPGV